MPVKHKSRAMFSKSWTLMLKKHVNLTSQFKERGTIKNAFFQEPTNLTVVQELQVIWIEPVSHVSTTSWLQSFFLHMVHSLYSYRHNFMTSGDICLAARFSLRKKQWIHLACLALSRKCSATPWWIPVLDAAPSVQTLAQFFQSMHLLAKLMSRQEIISAAVLVGSYLQKVSRNDPCRHRSFLQTQAIKLHWWSQQIHPTVWNSKDWIWFFKQLTFDIITRFN